MHLNLVLDEPFAMSHAPVMIRTGVTNHTIVSAGPDSAIPAVERSAAVVQWRGGLVDDGVKPEDDDEDEDEDEDDEDEDEDDEDDEDEDDEEDDADDQDHGSRACC